MPYYIRSRPVLRKILWVDAFLGSSTAITGLSLSVFLAPVLGLQWEIICAISGVTLVYSIVATFLASRKQIPVTGVRVLVYANWLWTILSFILLILRVHETTTLGTLFLVMQVIAVGGLAYLEGIQVIREKN